MTQRPLSYIEKGIVLGLKDAQFLAEVVLWAQENIARRSGQNINARTLKIAADIYSINGIREPHVDTIDECVEYEQIDAKEAANLLGCSTRNVRSLAARGRLPGRKRSGSWYFNRDDVEVFQQYR